MATRLNGDIRQQIVNNTIKGQFDPQFVQLDKDEIALSLRIYTQLVSPKHRKVLEEMVTLKLPYVTTTTNLPHMHCHASGGLNLSLLAKPPVILPNGTPFKLHGHPELDKAAIALNRKRMDAHTAKTAAWKALYASLNKVTTLEKLLEQWPEGKKYYQSPPLAKPLQLPAIRFNEINQMLGLS